MVGTNRLPIVKEACESGRYNAIVLLGGGDPGFFAAREIGRPVEVHVKVDTGLSRNGVTEAELPEVLTLAAHKNVAIKISGACTLSHEPYPYNDIWDPVCRMIDAFGIDRCLWGTDWTRAYAVVNYEQAVEPFRKTDRLSDSDRAMLMGGACAKAYRWSPKKG